ncbi:WxcM-like domain-containing protein [Daejeonella sp. H1SJ63]|uniref:WxcM-like domain-containing protein n=1 Tax=Daejeonella sp. H1SJ63 TaxID=3034145 RepID=UPI0023EDEBFB|nr:WxcM-like domain-containing protein [Daejeonella sp. H1SJ63]
MDIIEGVSLNFLKIIEHPKGNIMHALRKSDLSFKGFGEAYFSEIHKDEIKGWKRHKTMVLNLIVPIGEIKFVLFDERPDSASYMKFWQVNIGSGQYKRLTVPPMIWMAFQGVGDERNLLLNIASIEHDPNEAENRDLLNIDFKWEG